nr:MAG TPA: hypothetical protein [Caudoviricetes sp.]
MSDEKVRGTSRIIDEVDDYLKRISSTSTDFKTDEMGFGLKYLNKYFKPTNGESMLQYFDKILKGIENDVEMEKIATNDYLDLNQDGRDTVCELALAIVNYADERNVMALANQSINGDFVSTVDDLDYDKEDKEENKFIYVEDTMDKLGYRDIPLLLERLKGLGVLQKEVDTISDIAKDYAPFILDAVSNSNAPDGCYDLVLDLFNSLDTLNTLTRFVRKLKYLTKKEGRDIDVGYDTTRSTRSNKYVSDIKVGRREPRIDTSTLEQKAEMMKVAFKNLSDEAFSNRIMNIVKSAKNSDDFILDLYQFMRGNYFETKNYKNVIKAKIMARINEGAVNIEPLYEQLDNISAPLLAETLYYILYSLGSDDKQVVYDYVKLIEYPADMFNEDAMVIPENFDLKLLLAYTFISNDTEVMKLYSSTLKNKKLADAIQLLFLEDERRNYLMKPAIFEDWMLKAQPNFNGKYQVSDVVTYINQSLGGISRNSRLSTDDIQEFAEVVTDELNDIAGR